MVFGPLQQLGMVTSQIHKARNTLMCLILFAYDHHPSFPLILVANRDVYYDRLTAPAHWWKDAPHVYAGRDLVRGGTWLGVNKAGRFAAVTNFREPDALKGEKSRGDLVANFLRSSEPSVDNLAKVHCESGSYSGFNLLVGENRDSAYQISYYSNREGRVRRLKPGIYGLSNHLLDSPWPKVRRGLDRFRRVLISSEPETESFFELLKDHSLADDVELPNTGIGYDREKPLSGIYVETSNYGTRSSSVLTVNSSFQLDLKERVFE